MRGPRGQACGGGRHGPSRWRDGGSLEWGVRGGGMGEGQVGVFYWVDRREMPLERLYEERLQLLEAADRAGFYCYHLAEHHMTPLGMAPSPSVFLAAAAQRTRRIHLGPLVYLLPLYSPLRLIAEICMLDHLSGGRLEGGVGRGVLPHEGGYHGLAGGHTRAMFV